MALPRTWAHPSHPKIQEVIINPQEFSSASYSKITWSQTLRTGDDLHSSHVEDERWLAGVVDVNQVCVEEDVRIGAGLDSCVGGCGGVGAGWGREFGEESEGSEGDFGVGG